MTYLFNLIKKIKSIDQFDFIKISLASPKKIKSWSSGEVKKSETINYRTFKPEKDGLFCSRIFGPIKNFECLCGKYKRLKFRGIICEKCNVEVTLRSVRRERMGHINLAAPVVHIWFLKSLPSRLGIILNLKLKDIEKILYFENYIVIKPGKTSLKKNQIITEEVFLKKKEKYKDDFEAFIGAEGIKKILSLMDVKKIIKEIKISLKNSKSILKTKKYIKRLKIFKALDKNKIKAEWMILDILPVLPPDLRPLVPLEGGRFATSDLNNLYRRVINRNNRLKKLIFLDAPEVVLRNEKRMLQESVDALLDNGRRGKLVLSSNKRPLKSLSEIIKGKNGRFRQNLLGKRVDYSGRSVIVVGPELKLNECGLPKFMALELFKPFIIDKLESFGLSSTLYLSKKKIENNDPIIWKILNIIVKKHPVLLNRAPTLHRLGIQAFKPILIEGKAIKLHPLVCTAFNADFDGDQMAVHIPLSTEAQCEARFLMMSNKNILFPSNGEPSIAPSQDIVLGLYYVTQKIKNNKNKNMIFGDIYEVINAYNNKIIDLFTNITLRVYEKENYKDIKNFSYVFRRYETTVGRVMLYKILPKCLSFSLINKTLNKKKISKIISIVFVNCGIKKTVLFADKLSKFGFKMATISGLSICIDDMVIPKEKNNIILNSKKQIKKIEKDYFLNLITFKERYNKIIDVWSKASKDVSDVMMYQLRKEYKKNINCKEFLRKTFNPIYIMINSGARGTSMQIRQLAGMRGLMARPDNTIVETPILANFREGLDILQYFISSHGARKGLADTALKTANSGYLTRRLVDVAQDLVIIENDCLTKEGIEFKILIENDKIIESLGDRILGRFSLEKIINPNNKNIICNSNSLIDENIVEKIEMAGIKKVRVRSSLKCKTRYGLCIKCYGRDLGKGVLVNLGEAVGIVAAQSIGEPGTQLTMRTFHIGGATSRNFVISFIKSKTNGFVLFSSSLHFIINFKNELIVISRFGKIIIFNDLKKRKEEYEIPYGSILFVKNNDKIKIGDKLASWNPLIRPIISYYSGFVRFKNIIKGLTVEKKFDSLINKNILLVTGIKKFGKGLYCKTLRPQINFLDKFNRYKKKLNISTNTNEIINISFINDTKIIIKNKQFVNVGDIIAYVSIDAKETLDITGGLPRVSEIFEARVSKKSGILAEVSGNIYFGDEKKNKLYLNIVNSKGLRYSFSIPKNKQILVHDGQLVKKGEIIVDGPVNLHDILRISGIDVLSKYIINEVQKIYRSQGVKINEKHIEIIIKQMLRKVEIFFPGDSKYIIGEQVEKYELFNINDNLIINNKIPANYFQLLLGITKASLSTSSFISAASFQETTKVLTEASIMGKEDNLRGLKENVVIGRLIPAGTGFFLNKLKKN